MISNKLKKLCSNRFLRRSLPGLVNQRFHSDISRCKSEEFFFMDSVQDLLRKLTRVDLDKIFMARKEGVKFEAPTYKFMTTAELERARQDALRRADDKLQMPPVMSEREEIDHVLIKDSNLTGYSNSKFVFTDITYGVDDRLRNIVVRDEDGTLRQAKWQERDRMNQIYFPRPARKVVIPKLFNKDNLQSLLERGEFIFVLDSACCQFEPDDPLYIQVCHQTYEAIDSDSAYNVLRSTRHYGPFVFYLAINKKIDNLLMENIATDRLEDAVWLISLYHILNPDSKSSLKSAKHDRHLEFIESYIKDDSKQRDKLQLTLQTYREYLNSADSNIENHNN